MKINFSRLYGWLTKGYSRFSSRLPWGFALPPIHIFFLISDYCNLKCELCNWLPGKEAPPEKLPRQLDTAEVKGILGQLPAQALLTFTGGEAMVRADFMEVLEIASGRMKTHLITNGTLLTPEKIAKMVSVGMRNPLAGGLMMVGFSLHGDREVADRIARIPGTYDRVITAIAGLQEQKAKQGRRFPQLHITTVITGENLPLLTKIHSLAQELGVEYHNFVLQSNSDKVFARYESDRVGLYEKSPAVEQLDFRLLREQLAEIRNKSEGTPTEIRYSPPGITLEEIEKYHRGQTELADYFCGGLWTKMMISAYGDVHMCYRKLGNLRELPLEAIWNGVPYRELRREIKEKGLLSGCVECCYREYQGN